MSVIFISIIRRRDSDADLHYFTPSLDISNKYTHTSLTLMSNYKIGSIYHCLLSQDVLIEYCRDFSAIEVFLDFVEELFLAADLSGMEVIFQF